MKIKLRNVVEWFITVMTACLLLAGLPVHAQSPEISASPKAAMAQQIYLPLMIAAQESITIAEQRIDDTGLFYPEAAENLVINRSCPPTLRWGSRGYWVKELQGVLNLNYSSRRFSNFPYNFHPPLAKDGIFGPLTYRAVVNFQYARFPNNSKEWDGIVGPRTWHALSGEYC